MNNYKELFSNTVVFLLSNLASKFVLFLLIPLYTKYLSSEQYGTAELLVITCDIVMPIATLGMNNAVFRFTLEAKYSKLNVLKSYYFVFLLSILFVIAVSLVIKPFHNIGKYQIFFILIVCLSALNDGYGLFLKAMGKTIQYAISNFIYASSLLCFSYLFLVVEEKNIIGYFYSMILAKFVSIIFMYSFGNSPKFVNFFKIDKFLLTEMLVYSTPLIWNSICWWVISYSDRYMISFLVNDYYVGLYSVANKIPSLITTFSIVFIQAWGISAIKEFECNRNSIFFNKIFNLFNYFLIFSGSFLLLFIRPFMKLYIDSTYYEAIQYVPFLIVSAIILSYGNFFGVIFSAGKNSKLIMKSSLLAAIVNVVLNYFFIIQFSVLGAIISTIISYFVLALYRYINSLKFVGMHFDCKSIPISYFIILAQSVFATFDFYYYYFESICFVIVILLHAKTIGHYCKHTIHILLNKGVR